MSTKDLGREVFLLVDAEIFQILSMSILSLSRSTFSLFSILISVTCKGKMVVISIFK